MSWKWTDMENEARLRLPVVLDVAGPPCVGCGRWRPVAITDASGEYNGVRFCHAKEQFRDFSCFEEKG